MNSAAVRNNQRSPRSSSSLWLWRTAGTNKERVMGRRRQHLRATILLTLRLSKNSLRVRTCVRRRWLPVCYVWVTNKCSVLSFLDSRRQLELWQNGPKTENDLNINIPLLMQNKVPDGFEDGDHVKVDLRPESVSIQAGEFCSEEREHVWIHALTEMWASRQLNAINPLCA